MGHTELLLGRALNGGRNKVLLPVKFGAMRAPDGSFVGGLQIEYSIISRGIEENILPALQSLGIGVTAYGVLSRGLLSGSRPAGNGDFRAHLPRFAGANFDRNTGTLSSFNAIARERASRLHSWPSPGSSAAASTSFPS
jgi:hypothetical protein